MIYVRVLIVKSLVSYNLSKAAITATRFSCVRRQSELKIGAGECQILDYRVQQFNTFPAIAMGVAYESAASRFWNVYNNVVSKINQGDFERLPEVLLLSTYGLSENNLTKYSLSCCLKAVSSADAAAAINACRLPRGGRGCMNCSNLPNI
ncbi:Acyl-CoA dehydrogenase/oxidase C-terminal [Cinara cedri]|uniref:Acyl-CoA dehydrogenase/oxidase C-terminal n=1 Tax=Cinara cedri TaxID=506608 RepID=A0A5E4NKL0_9HEMI|nr:Acyl-CoA dehydrogenase/oxidase C-terminal [Cinara cedri]